MIWILTWMIFQDVGKLNYTHDLAQGDLPIMTTLISFKGQNRDQEYISSALSSKRNQLIRFPISEVAARKLILPGGNTFLVFCSLVMNSLSYMTVAE